MWFHSTRPPETQEHFGENWAEFLAEAHFRQLIAQSCSDIGRVLPPVDGFSSALRTRVRGATAVPRAQSAPVADGPENAQRSGGVRRSRRRRMRIHAAPPTQTRATSPHQARGPAHSDTGHLTASGARQRPLGHGPPHRIRHAAPPTRTRATSPHQARGPAHSDTGRPSASGARHRPPGHGPPSASGAGPRSSCSHRCRRARGWAQPTRWTRWRALDTARAPAGTGEPAVAVSDLRTAGAAQCDRARQHAFRDRNRPATPSSPQPRDRRAGRRSRGLRPPTSAASAPRSSSPAGSPGTTPRRSR
ncbi:hypothetical protein QE392_000512 [Microbacterium proteolyticum]|nr:hypothetical protein [Microbacterium sp. SORGH_AS_0344]MDQ1168708.1 hypothetical protein [Microbacterium proteolyticum]